MIFVVELAKLVDCSGFGSFSWSFSQGMGLTVISWAGRYCFFVLFQSVR